jgi:opacity protein-like surface antigen
MIRYCRRAAHPLPALFLTSLACLAHAAQAADEPAPKTGAKQSQADGREEILNSVAWRQVMEGLDEWFSSQSLYDRKESDAVKKELMQRVQKMSPDELAAFQEDLDAKLQMVLGAEGRDILGWVGANLAAAAPAYRKKMDLQYPDITKLTAAEVRDQLDLLERKRSSARSQNAALEQARQTRIAALQNAQRQQNDDRERALDRGAASFGSGGHPSPYHPNGMRQYPDVVSRPAYGWGFGFW